MTNKHVRKRSRCNQAGTELAQATRWAAESSASVPVGVSRSLNIMNRGEVNAYVEEAESGRHLYALLDTGAGVSAIKISKLNKNLYMNGNFGTNVHNNNISINWSLLRMIRVVKSKIEIYKIYYDSGLLVVPDTTFTY